MTHLNTHHSVAVVGAGMAGLAAACFLASKGIKPDVFEAEDEVGGLARGFDFNGGRADRFYHFICRGDRDLLNYAAELGLSRAIQWRRARTAFFRNGKLYPFTSPLDLLRFAPLSLGDRLRQGLEAWRWTRRRGFADLDRITAADWVRQRLGSGPYRVVWEPLLRAKFGQYAEQVNAAWLWHRAYRLARSRQTPLHPQSLGYFEGGSETIIRAVADAVQSRGGRIFTNRPVNAVILDRAGKLRGIRADRELQYDAVILALPLPLAAGLLPPALDRFRESLDRIKFLGIVCLVASLSRGVTGAFWCNISDPRLSLAGLIEMSELNPEIAPHGALVYAPFYLDRGSERWSWPDQRFRQELENALSVIDPALGPGAIQSFHVFRAPFAQAICPPGFSALKPSMDTPLPGLFLLESVHLYPEDRTLSGTIAKARELSEFVARALYR
jgi:protoporphyrinogen oxidase